MFLKFQRVHIDDEQSIDNLTGIEKHHSRIDDWFNSLHKVLKPAFERFTI